MRGNYFRRLLLACLLVVFFCGCVTALYTYIDRIQATEAEWKRSQLLLLEQVRDIGDLKLATAMNAVYNLKSRPQLIEYAQSNGDNPYVNTKVFQALGSFIEVYLSTGYKIDIFRTDASTVITREHTIDFTRYMEGLGLEKEEVMEQIKRESQGKYTALVNLEKWRMERSNDSTGNPEVLFAVVMDDPRYDQICFLVTLRIDDLFPKELQSDERFVIKIDDDIFADSSNVAEFKVNHLEKYEITSLSFPNWSYVYYVPMPSFGGIGLLQTVVIAITTIAAGALFAIIIALRTYRPVRQMIRQVKEFAPEKTSSLEPQDEFQVVHRIASSMHLENQKLTSMLDEYHKPMHEKLLRDLTMGMLSREEALRQLEAQKREQWIHRPLSVAIFHESDEMGLTLIDRSIVEGIERIVRKYSPGAEFIQMDNNRQAILLFHDDMDSPAALLQQMINEVHHKYPIRLTVSTGIKVDGVFDAVTSYHSAVRVLEQLRPLSRNSLLTTADLEEGTGYDYYYPLDLEKELIQSTLAQNSNEVASIIDSLLRGASFSTMNTAAYIQFTYSIHSTLHRIAQQLNCLLTDIFDEVPFQKLQQCGTLEEVRSTLLDMFAQVMQLATEKSKSVDQQLADNLISFIHTNYHQDISLTDLAHYVKLSPSYISTLFKMYHGDTFKDYLNHYRVAQAKLLIEQGEHKVSDISSQVGCNNVNTFIRIFKKAEGISPGLYIVQKHRGSEE